MPRATAAQDRDATASAAEEVLPGLDMASLRARLGRAVLALHDDGHRIDGDVTAYAILDLAENTRSHLVLAALLQTFAVTAGTARTPSGLLLASR